MLRRRDFLTAAALAPLAARSAAGGEAGFTFVHFTDTHIQPERRAAAGTAQAFRAMARIPHDFALAGGDLVMDVFEQGPARAKLLFDLYLSTARDLPKPVYSIVGNHDIYGISNKSGVSASDPLYAKKMFEDRLGQPRYRSFDHKGWHFILLDSVQTDEDGNWFGMIDAAQLDWLAADLSKTGRSTPLVVLTHMPLASATGQFSGSGPDLLRTLLISNPRPVFDLFAGYKLKAVLQGHTHVREVVEYGGCRYITPGAVCGGWWKGAFLGSPEGFAVLTVRGEEIACEFRTYGWQAGA